MGGRGPSAFASGVAAGAPGSPLRRAISASCLFSASCCSISSSRWRSISEDWASSLAACPRTDRSRRCSVAPSVSCAGGEAPTCCATAGRAAQPNSEPDAQPNSRRCIRRTACDVMRSPYTSGEQRWSQYTVPHCAQLSANRRSNDWSRGFSRAMTGLPRPFNARRRARGGRGLPRGVFPPFLHPRTRRKS